MSNAQPQLYSAETLPEHDEPSGDMLRFLRLWLTWAKHDGTGNELFNNRGLCRCWQRYIRDRHPQQRQEVAERLNELLEETTGDTIYPFNTGHMDYNNEVAAHLNPLRLSWVEAILTRWEGDADPFTPEELSNVSATP